MSITPAARASGIVMAASLAYLAFLPSTPAIAQTSTAASCSLRGDTYVCDKASFLRTLAAAHTYALIVRKGDDLATAHLDELAVSLGKTARTTGDPDLIFAMVPTEALMAPNGPPDAKLGNLLVYAKGSQGKPGPLLWAESFTGGPGEPWAVVIHNLIRQFKEHTAA